MFWRKKEEYVANYLGTFKSKEKGRYVVLDCEMSDLNLNKTYLLSVGVVEVLNGEILLETAKEWFLKQPNEAYTETAKIHNIVGDQDGVAPEQFIQEFLLYVRSAKLVAHNATIDMTVLNMMLQGLAKVRLKNKVTDTYKLALFQDFGTNPSHFKPEEYSLDALCQKHNIAITRRHSALGDALATAQLFLVLNHQNA